MADGIGCLCDAKSAGECGCTDVDWTTQEVYDLRKEVSDLQSRLDEAEKKVTWMTNNWMPGDTCGKHVTENKNLQSRLDLAVEASTELLDEYIVFQTKALNGASPTKAMEKLANALTKLKGNH